MFPRASQHSYGYHTGQVPPDLHQKGYVMLPYQATNHTVLLSELFSVQQWSSQAPHLVLSFLSFASSLPGHDNHLKTKNWHIGGISILKFKPCQIVSALQSEDCRCSFVEGVPCDHSSHPISKNYYLLPLKIALPSSQPNPNLSSARLQLVQQTILPGLSRSVPTIVRHEMWM